MNIEPEALKKAYRTMRMIREFEVQIAREFAAGTVPGMTHLYLGQEAIATGVCQDLCDEDYIASTHRGHGHCIAKGCDIRGMAFEIFRKAEGICKGKGGSMHIADVTKGMLGANAIVGGAAPLAGGAALAIKIRKQKNVSVAFVGDGAANQGTTLEEMNFAVVLKLPLVFVIESNGYGEHTGSNYANGADLTKRTEAFGIPTVKVDGTDFFAVYEAMLEATERAHRGEGPSCIECIAHRWNGHFEGDPQSYRDKKEIEDLKANFDPIKRFKNRVLHDLLLSVDDFDILDKQIIELVSSSILNAIAAPQPDSSELLTDVYVSY